ncbi:CBS domain-containing protein [Scatolibacter rhodanostii]|uniref:CBS domain-containing protein n=1 Tax=Scatolibacter rhodanostii TaxID=2014781 RepID=UPI000C06EC47|nr:CBS domain-containing protein [Scatolibacter rhodanostii]
MADVNEFLDLYKQMEDELEERYRGVRRRYSSVVMEFSKEQDSEPVRAKLDICREIRNLLTHNPNIGGMPVAEPSEPVIESMREILAYIRKPPLALDYAVQGKNIMKASLSQKVLRLMEIMDKNGYSHVPVMENGLFQGVFSAGSIFQYILNGGKSITVDTTMEQFRAHLPVEVHKENYAFAGADTTYLEVRNMFQRPKAKNKRVSVVFITKTGKQEEPLLGMIVPSDVLNEKDNGAVSG